MTANLGMNDFLLLGRLQVLSQPLSSADVVSDLRAPQHLSVNDWLVSLVSPQSDGNVQFLISSQDRQIDSLPRFKLVQSIL